MGFETIMLHSLFTQERDLNILPYGIWNWRWEQARLSLLYLNILPYGIWNSISTSKFAVASSIWTFFPMGFETNWRNMYPCILWNLNILPYGIWNFLIGMVNVFDCDLNILPYGIWNDPSCGTGIFSRTFEHSSLWDLKLSIYSPNTPPLKFEHSSLWDLKQYNLSSFARDRNIWTFFPMGFETFMQIFTPATKYIWTFFPMGFETRVW